MSSGFSDIEFVIKGCPVLLPAYAQQLALSILMGLLIGLERESKGKSASLRTFTVISAGSCLFTILSIHGITGGDGSPREFSDISRIAAQIVSGIGFIGGGVIFKTVDRIEGITTAALIWLVAALGMACGFNAISISLWAFSLFLFTHLLITSVYAIIFKIRGKELGK